MINVKHGPGSQIARQDNIRPWQRRHHRIGTEEVIFLCTMRLRNRHLAGARANRITRDQGFTGRTLHINFIAIAKCNEAKKLDRSAVPVLEQEYRAFGFPGILGMPNAGRFESGQNFSKNCLAW